LVGVTTAKDWVERRLEGARVERIEGIYGVRPDVSDLYRHPGGWWFVAVSPPPTGLARPRPSRPVRFAEVVEEEAEALSRSYGYGWPPKGAPPAAPARAPAPGPPAAEAVRPAEPGPPAEPDWIYGSQTKLGKFLDNLARGSCTKLLEKYHRLGRVKAYEPYGNIFRFVMTNPKEHERVKAHFTSTPKRKPRGYPYATACYRMLTHAIVSIIIM
jgi:hypothetical protein